MDDIKIDNISITDLSTGEKLITNGDFEEDSAGWSGVIDMETMERWPNGDGSLFPTNAVIVCGEVPVVDIEVTTDNAVLCVTCGPDQAEELRGHGIEVVEVDGLPTDRTIVVVGGRYSHPLLLGLDGISDKSVYVVGVDLAAEGVDMSPMEALAQYCMDDAMAQQAQMTSVGDMARMIINELDHTERFNDPHANRPSNWHPNNPKRRNLK